MDHNSFESTFDTKSSLPRGQGRDGIEEQITLLNQLSEKLDEYFALRTFGPEEGKVG